MSHVELPPARYLTCTWGVKADAGGQTRAMLMRNRMVHGAGIMPRILSFVPVPDIERRREELFDRGLMLPGTQLDSIYDHYRELGWPDEEPSGESLVDLRKDTINEEVRHDGTPWRITYQGARADDRIYDYQRSDGSTFLRIGHVSFSDPDSWPRRIQKVSREGEVVGRFPALGPWFRGWVRQIADGDRALVFLETRVLTPHLVPMRAPNIHLIQVMHNIHTQIPQRWDSSVVPLGQMLLDRMNDLDAVVTLTERQREDIALRRGDTNNLFVVPNPVVMPDESGPAERDPRLATIVARLAGQKRLTHAVAAFEKVVEAVPEARLEIFGDGPEREVLRDLIQRKGLSGSVILRGYDPRAREALSQSSAFLMTSRNEGYPLSTLESMSHGCPVVSYDIKYGPREQITEGVDGFLVPDGDIDLMAERVITLLTSPELVAKLSRGAVAKARTHSVEKYAEDWSHVLHAVVAQKEQRTILKSAHLEVRRLDVGTSGLLARLARRRPTAAVGVYDDGAVLSFRGVLRVEGRGVPESLEGARLELSAVQEVSGEIVDVPVAVDRDGNRFTVSAKAPLASLFGSAGAGECIHLRLRLVWQNTGWDARVTRPIGVRPRVEVAFLADESVLIQRPPAAGDA